MRIGLHVMTGMELASRQALMENDSRRQPARVSVHVWRAALCAVDQRRQPEIASRRRL